MHAWDGAQEVTAFVSRRVMDDWVDPRQPYRQLARKRHAAPRIHPSSHVQCTGDGLPENLRRTASEQFYTHPLREVRNVRGDRAARARRLGFAPTPLRNPQEGRNHLPSYNERPRAMDVPFSSPATPSTRLLQGAAIGFVLAVAIGFNWAGPGIGLGYRRHRQKIANQRAQTAVIAVLAPICAQKFLAQPDIAAKKAAFEKIESWKRRDGFPRSFHHAPGRFLSKLGPGRRLLGRDPEAPSGCRQVGTGAALSRPGLTVVTALLTVGNAPAWTNRRIPGLRAGRFVRPCGCGIEACRGVSNGRVPFRAKDQASCHSCHQA